MSISRLLNPRSVALAGVSSTEASLAGIVLENLERFAYGGEIFLLHRTVKRLRGRDCLASFAEIPVGVDCVVLAIPASGVLNAIKACAARDVGGVVIFSGGFAEVGADGRELQNEIAAIATANAIAVMGPNCLGFVNYVNGIPLTFSLVEPRPLAAFCVAIISQSGAMAAALSAALHGRNLDVAMSVSTGNEAATGLEDFMDYALKLPQVRVIALIAEHIRSPQRFLQVARDARSHGVIVVLLHPGRSLAAQQSAVTHTGAIVGDYAVMKTMVERAFVMFADTLEELIDLTDCASRCKHLPHGGVAVLSESGAYKAIALDYCETLNLTLPQPDAENAAVLNALAPGLVVSSNPLDLTAQSLSNPDLYDQAIGPLLANPDCGSLLVTVILSSARMAIRKMPPVVATLAKWARTHNVVFAMLGEDSPIPETLIREVQDLGVPFFRSPERALRTVSRLIQWSDTCRNAPADSILPAPRLPSGVMAEHAAKDVFERAGIHVGKRLLVFKLADAITAAQSIGFPVVLKVQSASIPHKFDVGGVVLDVRDERQLTSGWKTMLADIEANVPGVSIDGVLVERMAPAGLEFIVGARNDSEWGAVIAVGLGGLLAEVIEDVRLIPADLNAEAVGRELKKLRGARMLEKFRGRPARDVDALCEIIVLLGALVRSHREILELDINPLLVFANGKGTLALDALIRCS